MPSIKILFSPEIEIQRLRYTAAKIEWFKTHDYKLSLPSSWRGDRIPTDNEIIQMVNDEYYASIYVAQKQYLENHWRNIFNDVKTDIKKILPELRKEYTVYLTRYGVGGSYHFPETIYANISHWWQKGLVTDVLHEMVHLAIHPLIEKHKIPHWHKERIVDLVTLRISNKYGNAQKLKGDMTSADEIFDRFYPNIAIIVEQISRSITPTPPLE